MNSNLIFLREVLYLQIVAKASLLDKISQKGQKRSIVRSVW